MRFFISKRNGPHVGASVYDDDVEYQEENFFDACKQWEIDNAEWESQREEREQNRLRDDLIAAARVRLAELDAAAVRPLRAVVAGTSTEADHTRLAEIETEAQMIRSQIADLR